MSVFNGCFSVSGAQNQHRRWVDNQKRQQTSIQNATKDSANVSYIFQVFFISFNSSRFLPTKLSERKFVYLTQAFFYHHSVLRRGKKYSGVGKCSLVDIEFLDWVFSFDSWTFCTVLKMSIFRQIRKGVPLFTHAKLNCKRMCWSNYILRLHYLLHRTIRFRAYMTELQHQVPDRLLPVAKRVAWTLYEICDRDEVWNNYSPIYLEVLRGTWIHDLVVYIMAKWVPLNIMKLLADRQFSSKLHWNQQKDCLIHAGCLNASRKIKRDERWQHKMATLVLLNGMPLDCPVSSHYVIPPKVEIFKIR